MQKTINIRSAKEHNLKSVNIEIPKNKFVVVTGVSGSGKSSLAFDTIYAEGQRRYVESLSAYARQFLNIQNKPDVESITGLSPAIAIDQKTTSKNPRSTVGTATEIYDYIRLLYARIGIPYSPETGKPIESQTVSQMIDGIMKLPKETKIYLLAPLVRGHKGEHKKEILELKKRGFTRIKVDGKLHDISEMPNIDKNKKHNIEVIVDRIIIKEGLEKRLADSIETALKISDGLVFTEIVACPDETRKKGDVLIFSEKFACPVSGFTISEIEPRIFSFNSPFGACPECDGLGTEMAFNEDLIVPDKSLSIDEGALAPWASSQAKTYMQTLEGLSEHYDFSLTVPFHKLPKKIKNIILYGSGEEEINFTYTDGARVYKVTRPFEGLINNLDRRYRETDSDWVRNELAKYQSVSDCKLCDGYRLRQEALCVKINGNHAGQVAKLTIEEAYKWFSDLPKNLNKTHNQIAEKILKEITERLGFLKNVGLDYLTISRESGSLSGGESQRIRLASQIGSGLTGILYVLDEPSIGLHQCDNERLLKTLQHLRDLGNSVIVVEHDEDTMLHADYLIDMGLGAGIHGGEVIAEGTPEKVAKNKKSITGAYLRGEKSIPVPKKRRPTSEKKQITITGASCNNLKNVTASFPLGVFCSVTGVSGGGKSSLVIETLYKAGMKMLHNSKVNVGKHDSINGLEFIDKIIEIDQSPIGRTPRSNPATYTGAFGPIRDWFVKLPESKARGYRSGRFSFNVKGGRCEACQGDGVIKIEMHFLPDVYVRCDVCNGKRYNRETLEIKYKGKSISDVLEMTVEEATKFFSNIPLIHEKLVALNEVGLGYIKIGQPATTLSGGEAQRIKLAKELSKKSTGRTLYILDEPTTGLHSHDIQKLLKVLHSLVNAGNTVVVIEHNLDVIKTADWLIDIGPAGGDKGGEILVAGTPEDVAKCKKSKTGDYLKDKLKQKASVG